jgi:hypothetical protein
MRTHCALQRARRCTEARACASPTHRARNAASWCAASKGLQDAMSNSKVVLPALVDVDTLLGQSSELVGLGELTSQQTRRAERPVRRTRWERPAARFGTRTVRFLRSNTMNWLPTRAATPSAARNPSATGSRPSTATLGNRAGSIPNHGSSRQAHALGIICERRMSDDFPTLDGPFKRQLTPASGRRIVAVAHRQSAPSRTGEAPRSYHKHS